MRQFIASLLCLGLTFTTVFSGHPYESEHHHDNDEEHDHYDPSSISTKYPIVIPNQRSANIHSVHSAEVTEIGSPPSSNPQWGGPSSTSGTRRGDKFGGNNDNDPYQHPYKGYPDGGDDAGYRPTGGRVEDKKAPKSISGGLPRVQKYGYPPKCVDTYSKADVSIEHTSCQYMVVITLHVLYDKKEYAKEPYKYAHFKMSRKMDKPYGYVAVGLSKDEQMNDDHIVECVKSKNSVHPKMYHSWSNFHDLPTRLRDNSDIIKNKTENYDGKRNILTCEFDRPMITRVEYEKGDGPLKMQVFDLTKDKYYILMAKGETAKPDSDSLGMHGTRKSGDVSVFLPDYSGSASSSGRRDGLLTIFITLFCAYIVL